MIDFPSFDLILLAAICVSYAMRGRFQAGVLHDPLSALAAPAIAEAAAVPEVAATAAIPELAAASAIPAAASIAGDIGAGSLFGAPAAAADLGTGLFGAATPALAGTAEAGVVPSQLTGPLMAGTFGAEATMPAATTQAAALVPGGAFDTAAAPGAALSPAALTETPSTASAAVDAAATPATAAATGVPSTGVGSVSNVAGSLAGHDLAGTSGVGDWLGKNWDKLAKAGISGLGLLMSGGQNKPLPAQAALQNAAESAQTTAQTLQGYQITGTLPPGMKQIVDLNNASAKAAIRSQFADLGYAGSTAEKEALSQVDQASTAQIAQLADNLAKQGISFANLSAQEFNNLLQTQFAQETALQNSLSKFAQGLAGAIG